MDGGGLNFHGKRAQKLADQNDANYWTTGSEDRPRLHFDFGEDSNEIYLNNDNDTIRKMTEHCVPKGKVILNPIIDWTDEDVWEFIHTENLPYCCLYDEGHSRIGCIGCPMNTGRDTDFERWPKYKEAYLRTFDRMLQSRRKRGLKTDWVAAEEVMDWWLQKKPSKKKKEDSE